MNLHLSSIRVRHRLGLALLAACMLLSDSVRAQEKPGRLPKEIRSKLEPGLLAEYFSPNGTHQDSQLVRLPALQLKANEAPSSFVDPDNFTVKYSGYLRLKLKGTFKVSVRGHGKFTLALNGKKIIEQEKNDELAVVMSEVELVKGYNQFELSYAAADHDRSLRVYWSSDSFAQEPIPSTLFYALPDQDQVQSHLQIGRGRHLVFQHNCLKCHSTEQKVDSFLATRDTPDLSTAAQRLSPEWIQSWIMNPAHHRNDITMPALLDDSDKSKTTAANIAAFLCRDSAEEKRLSDNQNGDSDLGGEVFENLGCIGCHRFSKPDAEDEYDRVSLHFANAKFIPGKLSEFLMDSRKHYRWSRMPQFKLTTKQATDLEAYIREEAKGQIATLKKGDAETGQKEFVSVGCASCHQAGLKETATSKLESKWFVDNVAGGCLADERTKPEPQPIPHFSFDETDRDAIRMFLNSKSQKSLTVNPIAEFAQHQVTEMRCTTCHDLDQEQASLPYIQEEEGFVGLAPNRVPMLTFAGEKLLTSWSEKLLTGKLDYRVREHFRVSMPGFPVRGKQIAEGLASIHGFAGDENEPIKIEDAKVKLGTSVAEMDSGLSCNRCHAIGDRKPNAAFDAQSTNLIYAAHRLRKEYYVRWMLDPLRIDKQSKMPRFSEDRKTTSLKTVLDGDAKKQFDSLWHYLNSIKAK